MSTRYATTALAFGVALFLLGLRAEAQMRPVAELTKALSSGDAAARLRAIDDLGAYGPRAAEAVTQLAGLLKDPSAEVRAHAANALGKIGAAAKTAAPGLIGLVKDPDPVVRREAVKAMIGIRPDPQVTVPLMVKQLEEADFIVINRVDQLPASEVAELTQLLKRDFPGIPVLTSSAKTGQGFEAVGVIDLRPHRHGQELSGRVLVGVGQRQERQEDLAVAEIEGFEYRVGAGDVRQNVAVGQHDALGVAPGAGRVDEAGEVVAHQRGRGILTGRGALLP